MTARIRDLETALSTTQAQLSAQPHPLLQETPLNRENEAILQILEGGAISGANAEELRDAFGSLSIGEHGQVKYHGQSAGAGVCIRFLLTSSGYTNEYILVPAAVVASTFPPCVGDLFYLLAHGCF